MEKDKDIPACSVFLSPARHTKVVCKVSPYAGKQLEALICDICKLAHSPNNAHDYCESVELSNANLRRGNSTRPGREYHMAKMGLDIVQVAHPEVTFFGSGLNTDYQWIEKEYPSCKTKLVDLINMQGADNFESIDKATPSDVVVACEVIEHFLDPHTDFGCLFATLKPSGILICSTNINDGTDISKHQYPFVDGHCANWTPEALLVIAAKFGYFVDFRTPYISTKRAGPRKKYVIFYKDYGVLFGLSAFCDTHMYAPSELE